MSLQWLNQAQIALWACKWDIQCLKNCVYWTSINWLGKKWHKTKSTHFVLISQIFGIPRRRWLFKGPKLLFIPVWRSCCPSQHQTLALYVKPLWNKPECRQWLVHGSSRATWELLGLSQMLRETRYSFLSSEIGFESQNGVQKRIQSWFWRISKVLLRFEQQRKSRPIKKFKVFASSSAWGFSFFFRVAMRNAL